VAKPYKDYLPEVQPYSGEQPAIIPEAFLAQFRLYAQQHGVPERERLRQLIAKLTGEAQRWYALEFGNDPTRVSEATIAVGLRREFGREYEGVRALRAMYNVTVQPTQSGAQRLMALNLREEQARYLRVPLDAGPAEHRFSRVLALFRDEELTPFLATLTTDDTCSDETLRKLEEATPLSDDPDDRRTSNPLTSPAREALFARRVELAEAALRRIQVGPPPRARLARAAGSAGPAAEHPDSAEERATPSGPPAGPPRGAPPAAPSRDAPPSTPPLAHDQLVAICCRLTAEHTVQSLGSGFTGPPHYFGPNQDDATKRKNHVELKRRRAAGACFKCSMTDVTDVPFLDCPLHGARAPPGSNPATVGRTRTPRNT
jgi:hypothetical protein